MAGLVITSVGINLVATCISSLTSSANGIYTLVNNMSSSVSIPDITQFLNETDIVEKIKTLECLLNEIDNTKNPTKTLISSINSLGECVKEVEIKLKQVKSRMEYNKSLWLFSSLRSYGFSDIVKSLKILNNTLDQRQKNLFEILKINNYLTPMSESKYLSMK